MYYNQFKDFPVFVWFKKLCDLMSIKLYEITKPTWACVLKTKTFILTRYFSILKVCQFLLLNLSIYVWKKKRLIFNIFGFRNFHFQFKLVTTSYNSTFMYNPVTGRVRAETPACCDCTRLAEHWSCQPFRSTFIKNANRL